MAFCFACFGKVGEQRREEELLASQDARAKAAEAAQKSPLLEEETSDYLRHPIPILCLGAAIESKPPFLCNFDLQRPFGTFPTIFGHEAVGVVESVGEHVEEVQKGDIVVPVFLANCEECKDCKLEKSNVCSFYPFGIYPGMPRDGSSRFRDSKGGEGLPKG